MARQLNKIQLACVSEILKSISNDDDYNFDAQFIAAEMYQDAFRALHFSKPLPDSFWENAVNEVFLAEPETLAAARHFRVNNIVDLSLASAKQVFEQISTELKNLI